MLGGRDKEWVHRGQPGAGSVSTWRGAKVHCV